MFHLDSILKSRGIILPTKVHLVKAMFFSSNNVWMWELDHKECWAQKNWCFWTVMLEKTLENHLDSKKIQPVNPKGNQSWMLTGRTDAEAEIPILWPPDVKNWLMGTTLMLGKIEDQRRRGRQDEMVRWHYRLDGHEFEQDPGVGDGQGGLVCCSPWGHKESDMTEWLNCSSEFVHLHKIWLVLRFCSLQSNK